MYQILHTVPLSLVVIFSYAPSSNFPPPPPPGNYCTVPKCLDAVLCTIKLPLCSVTLRELGSLHQKPSVTVISDWIKSHLHGREDSNFLDTA